MIDSFQIRDFNKFPFSSNEQKIISHFTNEHNDKFNDNLSQLQIPQELKKNIITNNLHDEKVILTDNNMKEKCNHIERDTITKEISIERLLHKIRNLENEKKFLLRFLENKKNIELEYKKALETQAAYVNSENKKSQFYENEWLNMKSLEYSLINSGKEPLRQSLEMLYDDSNINKLGGLTRNQEMFIIKLIEDHKNLNKERSIISKKYNEAVDANFQLYQQNEMLKAQNISLLEKNKDLVNEELDKKLNALNSSLIYVQKENIQLQDVLDQYSKLIKNIKDCPDMKAVNDELNKFANYLSI
ncbi:conserved Plasmodium protein, unknown function [Plasmodium reichenowi]|uniref:Uncharacterized protein n=1 Tax=Plasmodium reichenowi TaxID=5854 RepID=A0A060RN67_PLARE|nr:conserved Plasmodium protein, unknown function [Plasmodium reichenowi]SOV75394.1 conserved Plasmodium protein, unknown function [Plasmodium reichenowi]